MPSTRTVLVVAFHFPPIQGSTGANRTLGLTRYIDKTEWDPVVLTVRESAYEMTLDQNYELIPENTHVVRAFAFDSKEKLSLRGRYLDITAIPDRWVSWIMGASLIARGVSRKFKPAVVVSTYPIATAHLVGAMLSFLLKIPWVAEFRDPMLQEAYPSGTIRRRIFKWLEGHIFSRADLVVVTTPGCKKRFVERYDRYLPQNIRVVPNGYDPSMFERVTFSRKNAREGRLKILHTGVLYPTERDPRNFFKAVKKILDNKEFDEKDFEFSLRGSGQEQEYSRLIDELGISENVALLPRISYFEALEEMTAVDALMVMQGSTCNDQIPAKVYEYMYTGLPILALSDPAGDTSETLRNEGIMHIAALESVEDMVTTITDFLIKLRQGQVAGVPRERSLRYSRQQQASDMAAIFDEAAAILDRDP